MNLARLGNLEADVTSLVWQTSPVTDVVAGMDVQAVSVLVLLVEEQRGDGALEPAVHRVELVSHLIARVAGVEVEVVDHVHRRLLEGLCCDS